MPKKELFARISNQAHKKLEAYAHQSSCSKSSALETIIENSSSFPSENHSLNGEIQSLKVMIEELQHTFLDRGTLDEKSTNQDDKSHSLSNQPQQTIQEPLVFTIAFLENFVKHINRLVASNLREASELEWGSKKEAEKFVSDSDFSTSLPISKDLIKRTSYILANLKLLEQYKETKSPHIVDSVQQSIRYAEVETNTIFSE